MRLIFSQRDSGDAIIIKHLLDYCRVNNLEFGALTAGVGYYIELSAVSVHVREIIRNYKLEFEIIE